MYILFYVFVTLAAMIYCAKAAQEMYQLFQVKRDSHYLKQLDELKENTYAEIEDTFDLWWLTAARDAVRTATRGLISEDALEAMPDSIVDTLINQRVNDYRRYALHLAMHARMDPQEKAFLNRLPKQSQVRKQMSDDRAEHERLLTEQRSVLLDAGVNIETLESQFRPTNS